MKKNYAYLLFALLFAFSACKEENVEGSLTREVIAQEPTLFTFIYKGKEYEELRANPDDPLQSEVIEKVLLTDNYSISLVSDRKNTYLLFDTSEDARKYFSEIDTNSRCQQETSTTSGGSSALLGLYRDKNYNNSGFVIPRDANASRLALVIDNSPFFNSFDNNRNSPSELNIPSLSASPYNFDNQTSSLHLQHGTTQENYNNGCQRRAYAILYNNSNYNGLSFVIYVPAGGLPIKISDLSDYLFYDFFGIKYGPSWNDKITSLRLFFTE